MNAKCAYCHLLRLPRSEVNKYICKLKLLRFGLVNESLEIDNIGNVPNDSDDDRAVEEIRDDLVERQNVYVRKQLKRHGFKRASDAVVEDKVEALAEERRRLIKELWVLMTKPKRCGSCKSFSPVFRKDKYNKVFRKPLLDKQLAVNVQSGMKKVNPIIVLAKARSDARKEKRAELEADEGIDVDEDESMEEEADDIETLENNGLLETSAADVPRKIKPSRPTSQEYVNPEEVHATLTLLFEKEQELLDLVYNSKAYAPGEVKVTADMFFFRTLLVPPNKYRPDAKTSSGAVTEAQQNSLYKKILDACDKLLQIQRELHGKEKSSYRQRDYNDFQNMWVQLQDAVNSLLDSDRNPAPLRGNLQHEEGIKQKLEKKEGLFRKNMMGKRVNFAARSVISPDPNIETNEIGVPPVFAKKLTYPEPVTNHNFYDLKEAVLNGPEKWPGAAAIENENGQVINLRNKNYEERQALANQLLAPSSTSVNGARNKKVHRHLNNGDIVIMNRQPTLHKPSMMCHRARVLPGEKTIRMHYANCNTYNADFDGDEMNMHFPQSESARAEALTIADTDHQYLVATSGKPLRGLIQDHISMGVWLTNRDTLFTRGEYHQLLYSCLRPEHNHTTSERIETIEPAILKPRAMWTGKQIITTVLKNIKPETHPGITFSGKSQTAKERWAETSEEQDVIFDKDHFLCGILDKAQLGPSNGGFIHAIYEAYGHTIAGKLLSILGRLLTKFLHMRAFSCGMEDIVLTPTGEKTRKEKLKGADNLGLDIASKYVTLENLTNPRDSELRNRLEDVLRDDTKQSGLDSVYNSKTANLSSEITKGCLPSGLRKDFPRNQMQAMTTSGAKGSSVNANLISCNLGQQVLEGRRVPIMVSGKSLPSFMPYETKLRAGGYITDRFFSGVRPQEYFFHAMAGREGLIDTAVKTSRSGYLQRCLIKGMEGLKVEYDTSVRDSDGSMVQFLYGEDGLDVTKQKHLTDFRFNAENFLSIFAQLNVSEGFTKIFTDAASDWNKAAIRKVRKTGDPAAMDPATAEFNPGSTWGATSEAFATALKSYIDNNPDRLIKDKKEVPDAEVSKRNFTTLMDMKYMKSVVDPGEAVGIVAGQSIGEPSTQMTLNTFHLAGHSAKNVTLGIPRLREIVMTASANISTPSMTLHLNDEISETDGTNFAKGITRLTLAEVVENVHVSERVDKGIGYHRAKIYDIKLELFPADEYEETYAIKREDVMKAIESVKGADGNDGFIALLSKAIRLDLKKKGSNRLMKSASQPEVGKAVRKRPDPANKGQNADDEETAETAAAADRAQADVNSEDEDDPDDDATQFKEKNRGANAYDEPDEDEAVMAREARAGSEDLEDEEETPEDEGYGVSPRTRPADASDDEDDEEGDAFKRKAREREDRVIGLHRDLTKFTFDEKGGSWCELSFEYDVSTAKILMLNHVEAACRKAVIQSIPGLGACLYSEEKVKDPATKKDVSVPVVITEGVNLTAMRDYQHIINPHKMFCNDIAAMLHLYGVEAARSTIIREMDSVFKGHSINVDNRHLNLIGDMMTRGGGFSAFNRTGMKSGVSPFMKMSFETTVGFLKDAVLDGDWDDLKGPSARIVTGRTSGVGTGSFDVLMPVSQKLDGTDH